MNLERNVVSTQAIINKLYVSTDDDNLKKFKCTLCIDS